MAYLSTVLCRAPILVCIIWRTPAKWSGSFTSNTHDMKNTSSCNQQHLQQTTAALKENNPPLQQNIQRYWNEWDTEYLEINWEGNKQSLTTTTTTTKKIPATEQKPAEDILFWNSSYVKLQIIFRICCFLKEWWSGLMFKGI